MNEIIDERIRKTEAEIHSIQNEIHVLESKQHQRRNKLSYLIREKEGLKNPHKEIIEHHHKTGE